MWRALTLCALCALTLAAIGCGDDDTDGETGGTGGGSGSDSGSGGKGGAGGGGGKGGSGGGSSGPTTQECVTASTKLFKDMPGALSSECISCACGESAPAMVACNEDEDCWPLIACVNTFECAGDTQLSCVQEHCMKYIGGGTKAQAIGKVLEGAKCMAKCAAPEMDGGVIDDAGM